ncbi:FtsX-like permease family protein [Roseivirga sp.]|uniref:FtsX-like permease family protein n=1 Tax=Roseivirga sp. TaxID=1964215 RepID=UPI003B8B008E
MALKELHIPPKPAEWFLKQVCKGNLLEEIEGDLFEHYQIIRETHPKWRADLAYWVHMVNFLRPFALKKIGQNSSTIIMYRSYFKFALRHMWRKKLSTGFNLLGLVLAFMVCGFIYLHLQQELSYDKFHENSEDMYRVAWMNDNPQTRTPHPLAQAMVNDLPEVEAAVSLSPIYGAGLTKQSVMLTLEKENISFAEPDGYFVDSTFFDVFDFKFLEGNPETALKSNFGVLLSKSTAERYFGDKPAVGNRLSMDVNTDMLEVVGVIEDAPKNSHFHYSFLISYVSLKSLSFNDPWMSWGDFGHFNYVKLKPGTDPEVLENKIPEWVKEYLGWSDEGVASLLAGEYKFELQPIEDIHLHSNIRWELEANSSFSYLIIYGVSGLFILLISVINFVNLSTARSAERLKEVGVKKTLGAYRSQLLSQFIFESLFSSFIALALGIFAMYALEDAFNQLVNGQILANDIWQTNAVIFMLGVTIVTAILAAAYPALYLNALNPGQILKGTTKKKIGGAFVRNTLLSVQLIAAILMVTGSLIISGQISFLKNKDLGFKRDNMMVVELSNYVDKSELIKSAFSKISGIESVASVSNVPGGQFNQHSIYAEKDPSLKTDAAEAFIDDDAISVLGIELIAGRMFDETIASDSSGTSFLINETGAKQLNLTNPVGETIFWEDNENLVKGRIVGLVKDFHYKSLHVPIRPIILMVQPRRLNYLIAQADTKNLSSLVPQMENAFKEIYPEDDFRLTFLDEQIAELYQEESRTLLLTSILSGISIFLAIAGLVGIVSIAIKQRVKEIGIRKILGASVKEILVLINGRYVIITLAALVLALPVSYLSMNKWMENFTYQNVINPMIFILTGLCAIFIIFMTISAISLKTVKSNPADSLRIE